METGTADVEGRHGTSASGGRYEDADRQTRVPPDGPFKEGYTIARPAAAGIPHHVHQSTSPYSSTHPRPAPPSSSIPSMISSDGGRQTSDEAESSHRRSQNSLPSIQELTGSLSGTSQAQTSSQRPSQLASGAPRNFTESSSEVRAYPRPEPSSTFSSSTQPPSYSRAIPPPPLPMYGGHQSSVQAYTGRDRETDLRQATEAAPRSRDYPHYSQQHVLSAPQQSAPYPPGQLSLPPLSPRQPGSAHLPSFETGRPPIHPDDDYRRKIYDAPPGRPFDPYPAYADAIKKIALSSRIVFNIAEAFDAAAREPTSRLPNEGEMSVMLENASNIQQSLNDVRNMIQHSRAHNERARDMVRESAVRKPLEDEVHAYNDHPQAQQPQHHQHHPHHPLHHQPVYPLADGKKRRGVSLEPPAHSGAPRVADPPRKRAAPPGRCHSCNRVDTPEWRRGPDGARTLCNACGLHYAKLERKRQSESRSLRPKPVHDP